MMIKIIYAQDTLIIKALERFSDKTEEVIMIYGNAEAQTVEDILKTAHNQGKKFRVIVVDSSPDYHGRNVLKRLANHGIKCQYTLISNAYFLIEKATKVFLPSTYILCNGAMVAPMGSSIIACLAKRHNIPVVAVCETYKFEDRVNLDQITNND